jgi:hypothetical protein
MEGRLRRGTRANPEQTRPITLSGWYRPLTAVDRPSKGADGPTVHFYGMSHACAWPMRCRRRRPP